MRDQAKGPPNSIEVILWISHQIFILFTDQGNQEMNYFFSIKKKKYITYHTKNRIVVIGDIIGQTGVPSDSSHRHISPPPPGIQAEGPASDKSSPPAQRGKEISRSERRIGAHRRQELRHRGRER